MKIELDTLSILYLMAVWLFNTKGSWKIWLLETGIYLVCRFVKMIAQVATKDEPKPNNQTTWDSYHV